MVEGSTHTNQHINENPVYSQQQKDYQHNTQRLSEILQFTSILISCGCKDNECGISY